MKNCIIIHGGPLTRTPEHPHHLHELYWQPWAKAELEKRGVPCHIPAMPNPWNPKYQEWKTELEKYPLNASTTLVGHSRGAAFLLRWLGETKNSIGKLILIAPNTKTNSPDPVLHNFYSFDIDGGIQHRVPERVIFTSENDAAENKTSARLIAQKLQCRVVTLPTHGHYVTDDMGGDEFPELITEIVQ